MEFWIIILACTTALLAIYAIIARMDISRLKLDLKLKGDKQYAQLMQFVWYNGFFNPESVFDLETIKSYLHEMALPEEERSAEFSNLGEEEFSRFQKFFLELNGIQHERFILHLNESKIGLDKYLAYDNPFLCPGKNYLSDSEELEQKVMRLLKAGVAECDTYYEIDLLFEAITEKERQFFHFPEAARTNVHWLDDQEWFKYMVTRADAITKNDAEWIFQKMKAGKLNDSNYYQETYSNCIVAYKMLDRQLISHQCLMNIKDEFTDVLSTIVHIFYKGSETDPDVALKYAELSKIFKKEGRALFNADSH